MPSYTTEVCLDSEVRDFLGRLQENQLGCFVALIWLFRGSVVGLAQSVLGVEG